VTRLSSDFRLSRIVRRRIPSRLLRGGAAPRAGARARARYCMVLPARDCTLKERIAGRGMEQVRGVSMQVIRALGHLHEHGRVHADVKPLNIMRVGGGDIKLIDLDASSRIGEAVCCKWSSAYLPPEALLLDEATGLVGVRQPGTVRREDVLFL